MFIKQTSIQDISPLSSAYLYEFARIPEEDQDLMKRLALRALNMIYTYTTGRVLTESNFEIYLDPNEVEYITRLPIRPIQSVTSVSTFDSDNVETTLDNTKYFLVEGDHELYFKEVPSTLRANRSVKVVVTAGYPDGEIPLDLLSAVEQLTVFLYENRGDTANNEIPLSIRLALDPYVIHRL